MVELRGQKVSADELLIRRAEPSDAASMQRVSIGRGAYSGTLQLPYVSVRNWVDRLQQDDPNKMVLVGLINSEIVTHAGLLIEPNLRRRHAAHLGITVADTHAGRGIGDLMMTALLDIADNWLHVLRVELTVFADNLAAQNLYRKHGFVQEGVLRAYAMRDGELVDTLYMARLHPKQVRLPS